MRRTGVWVSVFRNIIHQIFPEFLQPLRDFRTCAAWVGKQLVSPFYHGLLFICYWVFWVGLATLLAIGFTANNGCPRSIINIETWHRHGRGIIFFSIFSFSSLTITWCCCRWWRRRARRRCRTMPLLSWRCHWSWMMRTRRRTRWKAWNQVLRIATYPNPVFNEMWFLTIDSFIRISVFIAKLSERQCCWRVFEDFQSREFSNFFDIHRCFFMRLHISTGGYDYRRTTRFRQSIHFRRIQVLLADHMNQQILVPQV